MKSIHTFLNTDKIADRLNMQKSCIQHKMAEKMSLFFLPMRKNLTSLLFSAVICIVSFVLMACEEGMYKVLDHGDDVTEREPYISIITAPAVSGNSYTFIAVSDLHFGNSTYSHNDNDFYTKLSSLSPAPSFCVCLGDICQTGSKSQYDNYQEWVNKVNNILGGGNKVFTVVGNHDLYNNGWDNFKKMIYPNTSLYHFVCGGMSFYFTDTASGSMGKGQYNMIKSMMNGDPYPKIVCTHYPVYGTSNFFQNYYSMQNTEETDHLITLFHDKNVKAYLCGHMHPSTMYNNNLGFREYVLPSYADQNKFAIITVNNGNVSVTTDSF